jgi:hypothetical protein
VHLQQTDGVRDRHWPFTDETDAPGIINPSVVAATVDSSGRDRVELMLEPIPAPEETDDDVQDWVTESARRWSEAIDQLN